MGSLLDQSPLIHDQYRIRIPEVLEETGIHVAKLSYRGIVKW